MAWLCAQPMKTRLVNSGPFADAVVDRNIDGLAAEVVGHGQAIQAPSVAEAVTDEVHAPHLVDPSCDVQRRALGGWPANLLALAHRQVGLDVKPVHAIVIDVRDPGAASRARADSRIVDGHARSPRSWH